MVNFCDCLPIFPRQLTMLGVLLFLHMYTIILVGMLCRRTRGYLDASLCYRYGHINNSLHEFIYSYDIYLYVCGYMYQVWAYEHLPVGRPLCRAGPIFPRAKAWSDKEYQFDAHHSISYYRTGFDNLAAHEVCFFNSMP